MNGIGTFNQTVLICPACQSQISGTFAYGLELGEAVTDMGTTGKREIDARVEVTGLRFNHDCIPKTTR